MPEQLPQPRNIFEAINQNVYTIGRNQKTEMDMIVEMRKEIAELRAIFSTPPAPELPNAAPGNESAVKTEQ